MTLKQKIYQVEPQNFNALALEVFRYQASNNPVYAEYIRLLNIEAKDIQSIEKIPFLPISLFKTHKIAVDNIKPQVCFTSSGTTGTTTSKHYVSDTDFYNQIAQKGFEDQYGALEDYCFLALLPAYLERQGSSLVYMVNHFIEVSKYSESGFYLNNLKELATQIKSLQSKQIPIVLIGVSFALLDLAEAYEMDLSGVIIMETGGMKGRRKEITREHLHQILQKAFQQKQIHSEYGMTELLSQAYAPKNGWFQPANTMKVLLREISDPFSYVQTGKSGLINIIDLANLDSCSFIATDDIGRLNTLGQFQVLGRLDASDIRGCNLMVANLQ